MDLLLSEPPLAMIWVKLREVFPSGRDHGVHQAITTLTNLLLQLQGALDAPVPQEVALGLQHPSGWNYPQGPYPILTWGQGQTPHPQRLINPLAQFARTKLLFYIDIFWVKDRSKYAIWWTLIYPLNFTLLRCRSLFNLRLVCISKSNLNQNSRSEYN